MKHLWIAVCVAVFSCSCAVRVCCEEPQKVTVCQLQKDPAAFNHKLIEVEAFVSWGFEDFSLFDPVCRPSAQEVWLEYGGKAKSDTMYCCGPTAGKNRPRELTVENIPIPLVENDLFKQFDKEVQPPFRSEKFGSFVHATLIGRFFAGTRQLYGTQELRYSGSWGGYGHMGCCSLLAIQEVLSVDPQDRDDLDFGASPDQPDIERTGCGYSFLTPIMPGSEVLQAQQQAETDSNSRAFNDPERVASDFLVGHLKLDVGAPLKLKEKRRGQGRIVYEWKQAGKSGAYMVVVSRPSWLSFYAHDPKRVAWVVTAAYVSSCESGKQVTRIR